PDSRLWWAVVDGQMRVEIEGQAPLIATKGAIVQVPKQTLYSFETIGTTPSVRFEVNVARVTTLYPQSQHADKPAPVRGVEWAPLSIRRRPEPYDSGNQPMVNMYEAAHAAANYTGGFVVRDAR